MNQGEFQQADNVANQRAAAKLLIEAIVEKLRANETTLAKSLGYGRLTWRWKTGSRPEVDFEPKL
jgi:hypothetical protein